jgi:diadenosine tetraphosphatase ApaH/serine/threonine PP2A family protein phosphatase
VRIPLVSDIHANLAALDAVLLDASAAGADTPPWVLGDIVGYGPDPNEVVSRLRELSATAVAGNHDLAAAGQIGVAEFNPLAETAVRWTSRTLDDESRAYLSSLPTRMEREGFTLVHGSPRDPVWEYLTSVEAFIENLQHFTTQACLFGHTHIPGVVVATSDGLSLAEYKLERPIELGNDRLFLNPGSVGQPRDGEPRASYVILDPDERTVEFRRVDYEVSVTQERMRRAGLPKALINRLAFGR